MRNKSYRIAIVGGIAVGKSTIVNALYKGIYDCVLVEEDVKHNVFLPEFYENMKKWAFHSRISTIAMISHNYLQVSNDMPPKVILMDRCVDELITFARLHYDNGNLTDKEFMVYETLYNSIVQLAPPIDLFIYAHCSAQKSLERIKQRNRPYEQDITIDYINLLNNYYNDWIQTLEPHRVSYVDTNNGSPAESVMQIVTRITEHDIT